MKKIILILSLFFGAIGAWAQIPAEVTDVMNHCRAAMNNASGLEYEADMKAGMVNCSILDMSGRVVYTSTLNAEHTNSIDLSNVPAGAYFVRINNDSFVKVEKLIVR